MVAQVIRNGTLIDGNGGEPIANGAVLVEDGRISAVGKDGSFTVPDGAIELDAGGGTILPGTDRYPRPHHDGGVEYQQESSPRRSRSTSIRRSTIMRRTLDAGVTTVRDAGGADLGVKMAVEKGLIAGPRMQISISVLSITGGHGDGWQASGNEVRLFQPYPGNPDGTLRRPGRGPPQGPRNPARRGRGDQVLLDRRRRQPDRSPRIHPVQHRKSWR